MNYYNPYFYTMPTTLSTPKVGLLSRLFGKSGITLGTILNGTQRALNFANQAIPLVKQVKPMIGNAKTMFKVMNEFKRSEKQKQINTQVTIDKQEKTKKNNSNAENLNISNENQSIGSNAGPTFFI